MVVVFVHGWSVRHTDTYGELPRWLSKRSGVRTLDVYLGKYISLNDTVTMEDLARAFEQARREALPAGERFAAITHSTGGPLIRTWLDLYHRETACPLSHLVMLAPANHGSSLAQLGKGRLARLKFLLEGVEPGARVLDWLELASDESWALNTRWLDWPWRGRDIWPFVLTGQSIDRHLYDHLNSYTGEAGSDGVVRVAAANMNYGLIRLGQHAAVLEPAEAPRRSTPMAFGILPGLSHSGERMGILRSITIANAAQHPAAQWVLRCLEVATDADYARLTAELQMLRPPGRRCSMVLFRLLDDRGNLITDYDLYLTAGPHYDPDALPHRFFVDRQRNLRNPCGLAYYLDHDVMQSAGRLGFRVVARPDEGLAHYSPAEYRSELGAVDRILKPNETVMVEIQLERRLDGSLFTIGPM